MDAARDRPWLSPARTLVQAVAELLAGLEERDVFLGDAYGVAGPRVAADAGIPALDRKCPEPAKFDAVAAGERRCYLVENCGHYDLDVALVQMRVSFGKPLYELRFRHRYARVLWQGHQRAKASGNRQETDADTLTVWVRDIDVTLSSSLPCFPRPRPVGGRG